MSVGGYNNRALQLIKHVIQRISTFADALVGDEEEVERERKTEQKPEAESEQELEIGQKQSPTFERKQDPELERDEVNGAQQKQQQQLVSLTSPLLFLAHVTTHNFILS